MLSSRSNTLGYRVDHLQDSDARRPPPTAHSALGRQPDAAARAPLRRLSEEGEKKVNLNKAVHLKRRHGGGLVVGGMIYAWQSAVNID